MHTIECPVFQYSPNVFAFFIRLFSLIKRNRVYGLTLMNEYKKIANTQKKMYIRARARNSNWSFVISRLNRSVAGGRLIFVLYIFSLIIPWINFWQEYFIRCFWNIIGYLKADIFYWSLRKFGCEQKMAPNSFYTNNGISLIISIDWRMLQGSFQVNVYSIRLWRYDPLSHNQRKLYCLPDVFNINTSRTTIFFLIAATTFSNEYITYICMRSFFFSFIDLRCNHELTGRIYCNFSRHWISVY